MASSYQSLQLEEDIDTGIDFGAGDTRQNNNNKDRTVEYKLLLQKLKLLFPHKHNHRTKQRITSSHYSDFEIKNTQHDNHHLIYLTRAMLMVALGKLAGVR